MRTLLLRLVGVVVIAVLPWLTLAPLSVTAADCDAYAAGAVQQSQEYFSRQCTGGHPTWWNVEIPYHANWCKGLPSGSELPEQGMRDRAAVLAQCVTIAVPAEEDSEPRILTVEQRIDRCRGLTGEERDGCMVRVVVLEENPSLCRELPDSRCAEIVGVELMRRCAELPTEKERAACELVVAEETDSPEACPGAAYPEACITTIATLRNDPRLILERIADQDTRDSALFIYAGNHGDANVIALIKDPLIHDKAIAYAAINIVASEGPLGPEYCDRLRGGYADDFEGEQAERVRRECLMTVAMSNAAFAARDTMETDAERDTFARALESLSEAMQRGDVLLDDVIGQPN